MAVLRFSTALRNLRLGKTPLITDAGSQIAFVNATSKITDTQSRWLTAGFRPNDYFIGAGWNEANNNAVFKITSIAADGSEAYVTPAPTEDTAPAGTGTFTLVHPGKSLAHAMRYGVLYLYDGSMPASADTAPGANILAKVTIASGAVVAGTLTNGLIFDEPSLGVIDKPAGTVWSGVGLLAGTCTWCALYDNSLGTPVDTLYYYPRIYGDAGVSGAAFLLSDLDIAVGIPITCDQMQITEGNA